ncbi:TPA: hypothetical protein ACWYE0_001400 [Neisseria meningitidis]|nr:hypothetical protein [Neisseria meningitidis]
MRSRLGKRQNQQVHNRHAAEYACQDRQDRRTEYQGIAAQMPDRIKPSRNGGGADGIARQQGTAQTGVKPETSPTARHGDFFAPVAGGLDLSGAGLKAKRAGRRTV